MMKPNYCFLDIETTGFEPRKDSIIEVSFIVERDGKEIQRYDELFYPDKSEMSDFVSHLTGITQDDIEKEGKHIAQESEKIREIIGDSVIIGHNIGFDIQFLTDNGIDISENPYLDTHQLSRILLLSESSYALEVLSKKYDLVHDSAHRAMSDVIASRELFHLLERHIERLPTDFLSAVMPTLNEKSNWYAGSLFQNILGSSEQYTDKNTPPNASKDMSRKASIPENFPRKIGSGEPLFVEYDDNEKNARLILDLSEEYVSQEKKVVIISPHLFLFPEVARFPTPFVLFSIERFRVWEQEKSRLSDDETVFFIKCQLRHFLGMRGRDFFDIFHHIEAPFWDCVCETGDSATFAAIKREKLDIPVITLTPHAFFEFYADFEGRVILIQEGEKFVESLLTSPTQSFSLEDLLSSGDEQISNRTVFFTKRVFETIIEPRVPALGSFPSHVALRETEVFPDFSGEMQQIDPDNLDLSRWASFFGLPVSGTMRWIDYHPLHRTLRFNVWDRKRWDDAKRWLGKQSVVWFHRHFLDDKSRFFSNFAGQASGQVYRDFSVALEMNVQGQLVSSTDPSLHTKLGGLLYRSLEKNEGSPAMLFSSYATLRSVATELRNAHTGAEVIGEHLSGGIGKMKTFLKEKNQIIFLHKAACIPEISERTWGEIFVQKFPFPAPSPILKLLEQDQEMWDSWTITIVAARMRSFIACFPKHKRLFLADSRYHARWANTLMERARVKVNRIS